MAPTDGDGGDGDRVGKRGPSPRAPVAGGAEAFEGSADDDDEHAFAEAMRGARPLPPGHTRVTGEAPAARPRGKPAAAAAAPFVVEQVGDTIRGRAPHVAIKQVHELRAGAHAVDARLDLHGRARAEALRDLETFTVAARARGARALLVIHGSGHGSDAGGPVLRPAVWEWLASAAAVRAGVMAFTSARARDGGAGATLILLRRPPR
jgi:DNA-nicking Smr family endonuclease